jgi:hypothetical protein
MSTPSVVEQRAAALSLANQRRTTRAQLRRRISTGDLTLAAVLEDPPDELRDLIILDIVRIARGSRHSARYVAWLERMGRAAIVDGVNLMMPLGRASQRTRDWVAVYASWNLPVRRGSRRVDLDTYHDMGVAA